MQYDACVLKISMAWLQELHLSRCIFWVAKSQIKISKEMYKDNKQTEPHICSQKYFIMIVHWENLMHIDESINWSPHICPIY